MKLDLELVSIHIRPDYIRDGDGNMIRGETMKGTIW